MPIRTTVRTLCLLIVSVASAFAQSPPPASFYAAKTAGIGNYTYSVAVADLNADGKTDVVKVNSCTGNISVPG